MPHLSDGVAEDGTTATRCGHYVAIFDTGVDAMAHTQIATDLFVAIGCGSCRNSLARDLRDEMNATMPFAKEQLKKLLATSRWETKTE